MEASDILPYEQVEVLNINKLAPDSVPMLLKLSQTQEQFALTELLPGLLLKET